MPTGRIVPHRPHPPKISGFARRSRFAVVLAVCGAASFVSAQVPAGGEFRVPAATAGDQTLAPGRSIAVLPSGDFVVVWQDASPALDVVAQRLDRAGSRVGGEFRVNTYTTGFQGRAHVARLGGDDGFVVAWSSVNQDGSASSVFAQVFDKTGAPHGAEFRVNEHTPNGQYPTGIAGGGPGGRFVVVWRSDGQDGSGSGVFARRFERAGVPVGSEFRVNTFTLNEQYGGVPEMARDGSFLVVWESVSQDGSALGVFGLRFDAGGQPLGAEFRVNSYTFGNQGRPAIAMDAAGNAIAAWESQFQDGSGFGIYARRYDPAGAPIGGEFQVNVETTGAQASPSVSADEIGNFVVGFRANALPSFEIHGRRFMVDATPISGEFRVSTTTSSGGARDHTMAVDSVGNFLVDWNLDLLFATGLEVFAQRYGGLFPAGLRVDTAGNGVLEPGESAVPVRPSWTNQSGATLNVVGQLGNPMGPPGGVPGISLLQAIYPTVGDGGTAECTSCYTISLPAPMPRPVVHWDTTVDERILPMNLGQQKRWTLHVGDSFSDVPRANPFYRFIETLFHHGVTAGCAAAAYCPGATVSREEAGVLVLVAKEGSGYLPPVCGATPMFGDVPTTSPFCPWIEELARRGVVTGCGGGNYCPSLNASRDQTAVLVLRALDPALNPPACTTPAFNDVPASSPFCRWVEELARRGVVTGCGAGNYCPANPVTREQMGVFLGVTFGLSLYGL